MKEAFSYYVILEVRYDTTENEYEQEVDILRNENYNGNGLFQDLDTAREVMQNTIKNIVKEDEEDCDENHAVSYFINGLDGYVYQYDINENIADKIKYHNPTDWVYRRYYIKEIKI